MWAFRESLTVMCLSLPTTASEAWGGGGHNHGVSTGHTEGLLGQVSTLGDMQTPALSLHWAVQKAGGKVLLKPGGPWTLDLQSPRLLFQIQLLLNRS